jgi:WD40 repeat protein
LASGSLDESIIIWNYNNHASKTQIPFAHMSGITGIAWIDERRIVTTGNDGTVVTWKVSRE